MVNPQNSHVGAAARTALGDLAKGFVVNAQKPHRTGGLPGGRFDQSPFWPQPGKGKTIATASLLDQGGIAQGLKDPRLVATHIIANGQDKTRCQLT